MTRVSFDTFEELDASIKSSLFSVESNCIGKPLDHAAASEIAGKMNERLPAPIAPGLLVQSVSVSEDKMLTFNIVRDYPVVLSFDVSREGDWTFKGLCRG